MAGEITLRITARPLKIAFLVSSADDLERAGRLFTNIWGGIGSILIPLPTEDEIPYFIRALARYDPDLILTSTSELPAFLTSVLQSIPVPYALVSDEAIQEHVDGLNLLFTSLGQLPHTITALAHLYPTPLPESNVRILGASPANSLIWKLLYGMPSEVFQDYLITRLAASTYRLRENFEDLIQSCLIATHISTPISITRDKLRVAKSRVLFSGDELSMLESDRVDASFAVNLFVAHADDLDAMIAFWNSRRTPLTRNRYLLPLDLLLRAPSSVVSALRALTPLNALHIYCKTSQEDADHLLMMMSQAVHHSGLTIPISVYYDGFRYAMDVGQLAWGAETTNTRSISEHGLVRYAVPTEPPFSSRTVFGYDASIELSNGHKPALRWHPLSSRLLLNSEDRIVKARSNERGFGFLWIRTDLKVRPTEKGIAGVSAAGEELAVYLHSDEFVVTQYLAERGFELRPNSHTRYALGFIRRFGGFAHALDFVRRGVVPIIEGLSATRGTQSGLFKDQIRDYLIRQVGLEPADASKSVDELLPEMLKAGIVRRGIALRCPVCDLEEWYAVNQLSEEIECTGCLSRIQLSGEGPRYKFLPNELARRFIVTGGHAVLSTAAVLSAIESAGYTVFGGDLLRHGSKVSFAEVDLLKAVEDVLVVAECKAYKVIGSAEVDEICKSLVRTVAAARELEAKVLILGVVTRQYASELHERVMEVSDEARAFGIGLHMILNDKMYPFGNPEPVDPARVSLWRMSPDHILPSLERYVGEVSAGFGFGASGTQNHETIREWDRKLIDAGAPSG